MHGLLLTWMLFVRSNMPPLLQERILLDENTKHAREEIMNIPRTSRRQKSKAICNMS
jgi:Tfp pilus assembly protein PilN